MKSFLIIQILLFVSSFLRAQDTPFIYKVHFITSADLRYERLTQLNGVFVLGKSSIEKQLHFIDSLSFEEHIYFGSDSLVIIPGRYNYDPSGYHVLTNVQNKVQKFVLFRFSEFMFIIPTKEAEKFEKEFESAMRKFRYSALKAFQPDVRLFKSCAKLSERYFTMRISDREL